MENVPAENYDISAISEDCVDIEGKTFQEQYKYIQKAFK